MIRSRAAGGFAAAIVAVMVAGHPAFADPAPTVPVWSDAQAPRATPQFSVRMDALAAPAGGRGYRVSWSTSMATGGGVGVVELNIDARGAPTITRSPWVRPPFRPSADAVARFLDALEASQFDSLASVEDATTCVDGTDFRFEAVVDGKYHQVSFNCTEAHGVRAAVRALLEAASPPGKGAGQAPR